MLMPIKLRTTVPNIPVTVHLTGLDQNLFGSTVDVEVRENAFTGQMVLQLLLEWSMRYPM